MTKNKEDQPRGPLKADSRDDHKDCNIYKNSNIVDCVGRLDSGTCGWCFKYAKTTSPLKDREEGRRACAECGSTGNDTSWEVCVCGGKTFNVTEQNETSETYTEAKDRKVYNVDFDGVISIPNEDYSVNTPNPEVIKQVNKLYRTGHIIIVWTARQWSNASWLVGWLIQNEVPFHGVMMGKGGSDFYIDDKGLSLEKFKER